MANNQTRAHAQRDGGLTVHSTTTDAPILPIEQMERLHSLLPDKVDWVFEQTALEAQGVAAKPAASTPWYLWRVWQGKYSRFCPSSSAWAQRFIAPCWVKASLHPSLAARPLSD